MWINVGHNLCAPIPFANCRHVLDFGAARFRNSLQSYRPSCVGLRCVGNCIEDMKISSLESNTGAPSSFLWLRQVNADDSTYLGSSFIGRDHSKFIINSNKKSWTRMFRDTLWYNFQRVHVLITCNNIANGIRCDVAAHVRIIWNESAEYGPWWPC